MSVKVQCFVQKIQSDWKTENATVDIQVLFINIQNEEFEWIYYIATAHSLYRWLSARKT